MKKRMIPLVLSALILGGVVVANRFATPDEAAKAAAVALFKSLNEEQKKLALLPADDPDRYKEEFPAVARKGVTFDKLTPEQKKLADDVVKAMCSEYGSARCLEVAKQTPNDRRYITYYGDPEKDEKFAWRLAQHHLTLIYAEFGKAKVSEFGPVLLGGNPVKELWDEEDKILLDLYAALTPEEQKNVAKGIQISDLSSKAQGHAKSLLAKRIEVFSADRQKVLQGIVQHDGGVEKLKISISAPADKSFKTGGKYNWQIAGPSITCNWNTAGNNHIHMTVRGKVKGT